MSNATCIAPECSGDIHVKKWSLCKAHYNRWKYAGDLATPLASSVCKHCGAEVTRSAKVGPIGDYCDRLCRSRANYARRRDIYSARDRERTAQRLAMTRKTCPQCSGSFTPEKSMAQKFCSRKCGLDFHRDNSDNQCSERDCTRPVRARKVCNMHYKRLLRAEGKLQSEWDDRRRANYQKRRALKLQLPADSISPDAVYERDEWTCGICNEPVPRDSKYPDPLSPSIDHVLPLSKGGHHVMENVQLAHLECNVQKGNRIEADEMLV